MLLRALALFTPALLMAADATFPIPGNLRAEGIPPVPTALLERLDQYGNSRSASLQDWHPKRREVLISTRFGNTPQLHEVAMPMGARTQLTFLRDRVISGVYRPSNGSQILYSSDTGGGEWMQLYMMDQECGCTRLLTDGKSRNDNPLFSPDGQWLAYTSTKRNGAASDIYVANPDDSSPARLLLEVTSGGWAPLNWSKDGKSLVVMEYRSITDASLHLVDVATGARKQLTPDKGDFWSDAIFSRDGKQIYVATDQGSDFRRLAAIEIATSKLSFLRPGAKWDVTNLALSEDGTRLAYVTNEEGASVLHVMDLAAGTDVPLPKLPYGVISGPPVWRPGGLELAFSFLSAKHPADVFSIDTANGKLTRWTQSETGGVAASRFRDPELIRWPSFDKRMISGFLYAPSAKFPGPRPVIINIHGGPEGQSLPVYQGRNNYYLEELGIAILYPNVRGSTGYGKQYVNLDNGYKREDSVKDIGALLDWIKGRKDLDASRVMVMGGSYGGYMTLASMTLYNDRIRCALDTVGISNWVTFLKNTESYRRDLRRVEYGDERDPQMRDFLQTISPVSRVARITKPMFIVQGRNDPRVPYTESEQMVAALRKQGTPVWYLLASDEGHGFAKKSNQDIQNAAAVLFIRQHLLQ